MTTSVRVLGWLCLFVLLVHPTAGLAQFERVPRASQESAARRELARQGVDEEELRARLLTEGIDVDEMGPQELLAVRPRIEAIVAEMKAERADDAARDREREEAVEVEAAAAAAEEAGQNEADEIREAAEGGATAEEAVAEAEAEDRAALQPQNSGRIYGHGLFLGKTLDVYRASERARTPGNYILDTGDELAISIFGASQIDLLLEIGEDGFVKPPGLARIYLRGRSLDEARRLVRSRMAEYYVFDEGQFALSIDAARTISVSIYGEVGQSGTYTLSALNGPLNALVAAGGPTDRGSVRDIRLIRAGQSARVDVYTFLQNPTSDVGQMSLRDNDVIYVPLASEVVELRGAVRRPMAYELTPGESLDSLVTFAGGLTPRAAASATRVLRLEEGNLNVIDLTRAAYATFDPQDGDIVEIPGVNEPLENFVEVVGEVVVEGRFGMREGITLDDVISRAELRPSARRDVAFIRRRNDDNTERLIRVSLLPGEGGLSTPLRRGDLVNVLASSRYVDAATFEISGAVRAGELTSAYPQDGALTLEEAILLAGGLVANALPEALIIRTPRQNVEQREYIRVAIDEAHETQLEPFDQVIIYSAERFADAPTVSISGAVRAPTVTRYDPSLDINDLLYLGGGARFDAAADRVEVYRLSLDGNETRTLVESLEFDGDGMITGSFDLRPFDEVVVRSSAEFNPIESVTLNGEVRFPGSYARLRGANRVSDFVERAGGLTSDAFPEGATLLRSSDGIGYVVLELDEILADPTLPENIILRPGDQIDVPKPQELVTIFVSATNATQFGTDSLNRDGSIQVAYQGARSAKWYINRYAGGFDHDLAEKRSVAVVGSGGDVRETKSFLGVRSYPRLEPGGTIRVPRKPPKREKPQRERSSWSEVASALLAGVTTLVTVLVLLTQLDDE